MSRWVNGRFGELVADGHQWIQAGQRILKYRTDLFAPNLSQRRLTEVAKFLAVEDDRSAGDPCGLVQQPGDGGTRDGLAGTGLPDHAEDLSGLDLKADAVYRHQETTPCGNLHGEIFDIQ